jgi:hypothetical protein
MSIGTSIATRDLSTYEGGFSDLPDSVAHVTTLQLRNQDNYGSEYGFKGVDYDYKWLIRNTRESPKVGFPFISRHNALFSVTKRPALSAGILSQQVPYEVSVTIRYPETGTSLIMTAVAANLMAKLTVSQANMMLKMLNFES